MRTGTNKTGNNSTTSATTKNTASNPADQRQPLAQVPAAVGMRWWEKLSSQRIQVAVIAVVVLALVLGGRLVQLQAVQANDYAATALSGRIRDQVLPATRGAIVDSTGAVLAASTQARNVVIDQTLVKDPAQSAQVLAPLLAMPVEQVQEKLTGTRRFVYLAKMIQPLTWQQIAALKIPGVFSETVAERTYSSGELAANVLGFVGADGQGLTGLERTLNDQLAGVPGHAEYEVDTGGRQIPMGLSRETPPIPGKDVQLTLNRAIQWKAQVELQNALKKWDGDNGTVVVMDAHTGNLLALATSPTFDPNHPGKSPAKDRGDRSLSEVYEPGSTGKAMTAAAAIEEGAATPQTVFTVPDQLEVAGEKFSDHDKHPTVPMTLAGIMATSSNTGTILTADRIGKEKLSQYFRSFGIGSRTGLGLPGESAGLFAPVQQWSGTSMPTIAFGQGYAVTALQMASVYATLANGGVKMTPRLIAANRDEQGHWVPTPIAPGQQVVSPGTASAVSDMLEQVTSQAGTAPLAAIQGYRVAGKTGTANRSNPDGGGYKGYSSSFIGFAPADAVPDPSSAQPKKIVVAVTIHDPKKGHYGGSVAGPVFSSVMSFALETLKIVPTGSPKPAMMLQAGG